MKSQISQAALLFCCLSTTATHLHAKDFWNRVSTRKNEQTLTTSTFRVQVREKCPQKGEQKPRTGLEEVLEQLIDITSALKSDGLHSTGNIFL